MVEIGHECPRSLNQRATADPLNLQSFAGRHHRFVLGKTGIMSCKKMGILLGWEKH